MMICLFQKTLVFKTPLATSIFTILLFSCLIFSQKANAQGCSDAGFCTMGAMKPDQSYYKQLNVRLKSVEIGQYVGTTRFGDIILAYFGDVNIAIKDKTVLQIKLPYQMTYGDMANTGGFSDISLSLTQNLVAKENVQVNLTIGTKIPTNDASRTHDNGNVLPMYYQSSLGTYDIIFGGSLKTRKWLFAVGYQQALNDIENDFVWSDWVDHELEEVSLIYPQSQRLKRGKDIMFRVERNFRFAKFNFNIGLLPIYRLNRDQIISPADNETIIKVDGTEGLALSLLYGFGYNFNVKSGIKIGFGNRLERRPKNPDGLSREFVSTIGYFYKF